MAASTPVHTPPAEESEAGASPGRDAPRQEKSGQATELPDPARGNVTWFLLVLGAVVLWLAVRGRLVNVAHALENPGTHAASSAIGDRTTSSLGPAPPSAGLPSGFLPNEFGLSEIRGYTYGENYAPQTAGLDQQGLTNSGGGRFAHDYDYLLSPGAHEQVSLPGSASDHYTLVAENSPPGAGTFEAWTDSHGGVFLLGHLSAAANIPVGSQAIGGQNVGVSGAPTDSYYGSGSHLAVITDTTADRDLRALA